MDYNPIVSLFPDTYETTPEQHLFLREALIMQKDGSTLALIERLRSIEEKDLQAKFKEQLLPALTFGGKFEHRSEGGLVLPSGLVVGDLDGLEDVDIAKAVLRKDAYTAFYFTSPRGSGLKVGVRISPVAINHKTFRKAVDAIASYHADKYGLKWDIGGSREISRLCYVSYDPDLCMNLNASPFQVSGMGYECWLATIGDHPAGFGFHDAITPCAAAYASRYGRQTNLEELKRIIIERCEEATWANDRWRSRLHEIDKAICSALEKYGDHDGPDTEIETTLKRLAALPPIQYDRVREKEAKALGIRVSILDAEVKARRPKRDGSETNRGITLEDPEPCCEPVDGATLLDDLVDIFTRYLILPAGAAELLALWVIFTYAHPAFMISPILGIVSPEKRCGKTTLLTLLRRLVAKPLPSANVTPAVVYRSIEMYQPTLLIDEADTFLKDNDELRGVINSGHTRDAAFVLRSDGDNNDPRSFSTWGPKAIALIGKLPDTLADRALILRMRRKKRGEKVEKLRLDRLTMFADIPGRCARWVQDHTDALIASDPDMPDGLNDRAEDNWRPLMAIVEQAGWTHKAKMAVIHMEGPEDDTESAGVLLLGDMRWMFTERKTDRIASKELAEELAEMEDRPWPEWKNDRPITVRQIARLLAKYDIRPKTLKGIAAGKDAKGYERNDCEEAFDSYIPLPNSESDPSLPSPTSNGADLRENPIRHPRQSVTDRKSANPMPLLHGDGVTDQTLPSSDNGGYKAGDRCPQRNCIGSLKLVTGNALMCGHCYWKPDDDKPMPIDAGYIEEPEDDMPF